MPTKFFGTVRQSFFWRKNVITRIMHKNFRYPKTFETLKGFPRKLSALWDKKFSREKRDTPFMRKISRYHNISETLQGCSRNLSALWDHVFSTEKWDTPPLFSSVKTFRNQKFSQKQSDSLTKSFCNVRQTIFRGKLWHPFYAYFFSIPEFFWNIEGMPTKISGTVRQRISDGKTW